MLAPARVEDGWFEALVIAVNGDMLTLRWRDYPHERTVVRRRTQLALLPPDGALISSNLGWETSPGAPSILNWPSLTMNDIVNVTAIRDLNDQLRQSLAGGVLVMTAGVIALGQAHQQKILEAVAKFDSFDEGNDPYGEHDFGALEVEGERLFFKIDYFDRELTSTFTRPG